MAAFPMPPPNPPPSWIEKWAAAYPGSGLALILNMVRDIQAANQGGRTLVDVARETYSGSPGRVAADVLSLGPLAPLGAVSPSFRTAVSAPDVGLLGLAAPLGAVNLSKAVNWRPPRAVADRLKQLWGEGSWFTPEGRELGLMEDSGVAGIKTHGITAMELAGTAPTPGAATKAIDQLLGKDWIRVRANTVQASPSAMQTIAFQKAVERASGTAKATGKNAIQVDLFPYQTETSRTVPLEEIPDFLSNPDRFLRRAPNWIDTSHY